MSEKENWSPSRRIWLRIGLCYLALTPLSGGLWALLFPRSFYDNFPLPGSDWMSTLGPYNEHLVRDYGALNLALAALLAAAAIVLERRLTRYALVTWLVLEVPQLVFHLGQTHHLSPGSNLAQLGGLAILVLLPLALIFVTGVPSHGGERVWQRHAGSRPGGRSAP